ncbi:TetR/AcrR family transcriptional regulator [Rothia halotolerans]|uniref:TetR/AcrR family transcriptional regulator n=1 Tax=Rothia halotolerans TaxID=405770 RepID=UPI00101BA32F|nr:TetR/AcrR family transcriptional regulator [Rothia halotolerans]
MPRRNTVNRCEMSRRIILASVELFAEVGYGSASMDEVARRCGVSKPMVYRYFSSKAEIYEKIVTVHSEGFLEILDGMDPGAKSDVGGALSLLKAFMDFAREHSSAYEIVFESESLFMPDVAELIGEFTEALRMRILRDYPAMLTPGLRGSARIAEVQILLGSTINIARKLARAEDAEEREMLVQLYLSLTGIPFQPADRERCRLRSSASSLPASAGTPAVCSPSPPGSGG